MKAAYYHPDSSLRRAGARTPMRAALDKAGIDIVDTALEKLPDVDVCIAEGRGPDEADSARLAACRELDIPLVVFEPDTTIAANDLGGAALQIAGQARLIVTTSGLTARYFEKLKSANVALLTPFVDAEPFRAAYNVRQLHKPRVASQLRLPESSPWLLTNGAMEAGDSLQSYETLVSALSRLVMLDWWLIVNASGDAIGEVKELLLRLPQDRIRYCEPAHGLDLAALCASCDLYVWPAVGDSSPGPLLEAQAGGLPVVAGRKDDTEDRVIDGRTGRLTPTDNTESFANAVSFLLRHPDFRRSFSEDARETVHSQFNLDTAATRLREILAELCQ